MKSKTNLGGLISTIGVTLAGVGTLSELTQLSPASNVLTPAQLAVLWYVALAGFVMKGIGAAVTSYYAADDKDMQNVAQAVDNINKTGPSPFAPPSTTDTTQIKK